MKNLSHEIKDSEVLIDDYSYIDAIEEVCIFDDQLRDKGVMGKWARCLVESKKWKKTEETNGVKRWVRLSKYPS